MSNNKATKRITADNTDDIIPDEATIKRIKNEIYDSIGASMSYTEKEIRACFVPEEAEDFIELRKRVTENNLFAIEHDDSATPMAADDPVPYS